jgi:hypothetical protein
VQQPTDYATWNAVSLAFLPRIWNHGSRRFERLTSDDVCALLGSIGTSAMGPSPSPVSLLLPLVRSRAVVRRSQDHIHSRSQRTPCFNAVLSDKLEHPPDLRCFDCRCMSRLLPVFCVVGISMFCLFNQPYGDLSMYEMRHRLFRCRKESLILFLAVSITLYKVSWLSANFLLEPATHALRDGSCLADKSFTAS